MDTSPHQMIPGPEIRQYLEQLQAKDQAKIGQLKAAWEKRQQQLLRPNTQALLASQTVFLQKIRQDIAQYRIESKKDAVGRFHLMVASMQQSQNPYILVIAADLVEVWNIIRKKDLPIQDIKLMIDYVMDKLNESAIRQYIEYLLDLENQRS